MALGRRAGELAGIATTFLLGMYYLSQALRMPFWTERGIPGGGFFPTLLGIVMISLSLLLLVETLGELSRLHGGGEIDWGVIGKPLYVLLTLVGYLFLFRILGYVLASATLIWVLLWAFDPDRSAARRAAKATAASILIVGLFYVVFVSLLALDIPVWPFGG